MAMVKGQNSEYTIISSLGWWMGAEMFPADLYYSTLHTHTHATVKTNPLTD
jgi:hypothetical protein